MEGTRGVVDDGYVCCELHAALFLHGPFGRSFAHYCSKLVCVPPQMRLQDCLHAPILILDRWARVLFAAALVHTVLRTLSPKYLFYYIQHSSSSSSIPRRAKALSAGHAT